MATQPDQPRVVIQGGAPPPWLSGGQVEQGSPSVYVNGMAIYYSPIERAASGELRFNVTYRIAQSVVMSPQHAKAMLAALAKNIQEYEAEHGEIPAVEGSTSAATPSSQASDQIDVSRDG